MFKKKSGDIFPALVTNTPLYNESGVFVGVISVTHDARPLNGEATVIDNHSSVSSEAGDRANKNNEMGKSKVEFQQLFEHPIASKVSNVVGFSFSSISLFSNSELHQKLGTLRSLHSVSILVS